jgi:hypothetical protein
MAQRRLESIESGKGKRKRVEEEVDFQLLYASIVMTGIEKNNTTYH